MSRAEGHFKVLPAAVAVLGACLGLTFAPIPSARAVTIDEQTRTVTASRLSMAFSTVGPNADVVNEVKWTDSAGVQGANLAADSGEATCATKQLGYPANFWGASYGSEEALQPKLVYDGSEGSWTSPAANQVQTDTDDPVVCMGSAVPVSTTYTYYDEGPAANEIEVQRTWRFDLVMNPQVGKSTALRAYVPQLPLAQYGQVLFPSAGRLVDLNANQCANAACLQPLSAGWFAIDDEKPGDANAGSGVIVLRDASDSPGAQLAIQALENPSPAHSEPIANVSSVALPISPGGLTSALSETEYLCFYDATSWPQAQREALELPAGCGPVPAPAQSGNTGGGPPPGGAAGGGGAGKGAPGPLPPLPAPVLGHSFDVAPAGGTVRVLPPGSHTFTPLTQALQLPFGSIVDATHGIVTITTAVPHGGTQTGQFFDGEFVLRQGPSGEVVAVLAGGNFSVCPTARERRHLARVGSAHASGGHTVRKLWANAHGQFSTQGNYAAGAVQGTEWLTEDRCDGTLIRVTRDRVAVTNLLTHHHLTVHAGHSYFAKAP